MIVAPQVSPAPKLASSTRSPSLINPERLASSRAMGMEADEVFNRRMYAFGVEARAAGAYGFWQLSFGSTGVG